MLQKLRRVFTAWRKQEDGTTAIEFSLAAFPFLLTAIGIIEISLMFTAGSLLEGGLHDASRLIRTGQIQQSGGDPQQIFEDAFCNQVSFMIDCDSIGYEAITIPSGSFFDASALQPQFDGSGAFVPSGFDPGEVSDVVLVRAIYEYPLMTPLIGHLMTGGEGRYRFITTTIFQNEPYEFVEP